MSVRYSSNIIFSSVHSKYVTANLVPQHIRMISIIPPAFMSACLQHMVVTYFTIGLLFPRRCRMKRTRFVYCWNLISQVYTKLVRTEEVIYPHRQIIMSYIVYHPNPIGKRIPVLVMSIYPETFRSFLAHLWNQDFDHIYHHLLIPHVDPNHNDFLSSQQKAIISYFLYKIIQWKYGVGFA